MIMRKLKILIACAGILLVTGCSKNVHTGKSTAGNSVNNVVRLLNRLRLKASRHSAQIWLSLRIVMIQRIMT